MLVKNIVDEDFVNYKTTSMFVGCHSCSFKCDKLAGVPVCQNSTLAKAPNIEISIEALAKRYLTNPISRSVVFGGLEPFDDIENVISFIKEIRKANCYDDVVLYTGYTKEEITTIFKKYFDELKTLKNIVIKFGRFIPNANNRYDDILGIELHSENQFAERIC